LLRFLLLKVSVLLGELGFDTSRVCRVGCQGVPAGLEIAKTTNNWLVLPVVLYYKFDFALSEVDLIFLEYCGFHSSFSWVLARQTRRVKASLPDAQQLRQTRRKLQFINPTHIPHMQTPFRSCFERSLNFLLARVSSFLYCLAFIVLLFVSCLWYTQDAVQDLPCLQRHVYTYVYMCTYINIYIYAYTV